MWVYVVKLFRKCYQDMMLLLSAEIEKWDHRVKHLLSQKKLSKEYSWEKLIFMLINSPFITFLIKYISLLHVLHWLHKVIKFTSCKDGKRLGGSHLLQGVSWRALGIQAGWWERLWTAPAHFSGNLFLNEFEWKGSIIKELFYKTTKTLSVKIFLALLIMVTHTETARFYQSSIY